MNDAAPGREAIRVRFLKVDTSNVADVLDDMGPPSSGAGRRFQAISRVRRKACGLGLHDPRPDDPVCGKG